VFGPTAALTVPLVLLSHHEERAAHHGNLAAQHLPQLRLGLGAHQRTNEGARRRPADDAGQKVVLIEGAQNAQMVDAEAATAAEQQGRATVTHAQLEEPVGMRSHRVA